MQHQLTQEQQEAVERYAAGGHLRIVAFAGAGKTSTLKAMSRAVPGRYASYIAFNKAIASEASAEFGGNVTCRTAHSFAFRTVAQAGYQDAKMRTALNTRNMFSDGGLHVADPCDLGRSVVLQCVTGALRRFCQSADDVPSVEHVWKPVAPVDARLWYGDAAPEVAKLARAIWERMVDPGSATPLGHDGYLKRWQLMRPVLPGATILVDEAQDLNPVLIDVVSRQHAQIVSVGDSHQQIYAWRGAVDALQQLPGDVVRLTQSFRFGENIAAYGNRLLAAMGETVPLRGNGTSLDYVDDHDGETSAILCRTNSGVIENVARLLANNWRVCVPGGVGELIALVEDAERLQAERTPRSADLFGFKTWQEVVEFSETEDGRGLKTFVKLVERHGVVKLRDILSRISPQQVAGAVSVSTAHRAKGLEWDEVELHSDFMLCESDEGPPMAERRLFYVAATRAQHGLVVKREVTSNFS